MLTITRGNATAATADSTTFTYKITRTAPTPATVVVGPTTPTAPAARPYTYKWTGLKTKRTSTTYVAEVTQTDAAGNSTTVLTDAWTIDG